MKTLLAALAAAVLAAEPTVTGTWNMGLQGDHVIPTALVLKQDGRTVTGTIAMPTQNGQRIEVKLSGEFVDGAITLSGEVENAKVPSTLEMKGTLKDDGTLEGTLKSHHGTMGWTAERLKTRK